MRTIYCCYSVRLRDYLYEHGVKYEICALNPNSKNMFWAYVRNEQLDKLLTKWANGDR